MGIGVKMHFSEHFQYKTLKLSSESNPSSKAIFTLSQYKKLIEQNGVWK